MNLSNNDFLTTITSKRNYELVCDQIILAIKHGQFQQGNRIPAESELGDAFGIGRGSIREAIKSLQIQGILESFPGKGTFVTKDALMRIRNRDLLISLLDDDSLKYLLEIRFILEPQIACYAATRGSNEDIETLFSIVEKMRAGKDQADIMRFGSEFHQKLANMSGNPILINLYDSIADPILRLRRTEFVTLEFDRCGTEEHFEIAQAIKKRNGDLAKKLMYEHLLSSYVPYSQLLK